MELAEIKNLLKNMISASREDESEYRNCAGEALSDELCEMLGERAERAAIYRRELDALLREMGGGTAALQVVHGRRGPAWRACGRASVSDETLLMECERKEDELLVRYRDVLEEDLPANVRRVFERQFAALLDERVYVSDVKERFDLRINATAPSGREATAVK